MKFIGWQNRSSEMWPGGPWSPDLILVEWDGRTRTDIQIGVPKSVPVFATPEQAKGEAYKVAVRAAQNLLGHDIRNGLIEVPR